MAALGGGSTVSRPKSMLYCKKTAPMSSFASPLALPSTGQARDPGGKAGLSQGARWMNTTLQGGVEKQGGNLTVSVDHLSHNPPQD